jgi:hypothetical protein
LTALEALARAILWVYADRRRTLLINAGVFVVLIAIAQVHQAVADGGAACGTGTPGLIDSTAANIQTLAASWPTTMLGGITPLYWSILGLGICFALAFEMPGTNGNPGAVFTVLAKYLFLPVFLSGLFFAAPTLGPALVDGLISTGAGADTAAGVTPPFTSLSTIEPGHVFVQFDCMVTVVDDSLYKPAMLFDFVAQPLIVLKTAIQTAVAEFTIHASGLIAMVELFAFQVEATFVLGIGIVLMVGIASQATMGFPMRYLGALVGLGIKGAALVLLIGVMLAEATAFQTSLSALAAAGKPINSSTLDIVSMTLLALVAIAWFVPNMLSSLGGAPGVNFGSAIAAALTLSQVLNTVRGLGGGSKGPAPKPPAPTSPNPPAPPPIILSP